MKRNLYVALVCLAVYLPMPHVARAGDSTDVDKLVDDLLSDVGENMKLTDSAQKLRSNPSATHDDTVAFVNIYRQLAERGLPWANFQMGQAYGLGWGMPKDSVEEVKWYSKAAGMGEIRAMRSVGIANLMGWGLAQDIPAGLQWLDSASKLGNLDATAYLCDVYWGKTPYSPRDDQKAIKYLWIAADSGIERCQFMIFDLLNDDSSIVYDATSAAQWAEFLANKGHTEYEHIVGYNYEIGRGVDIDYEKAGWHYLSAANHDDAFGYTGLATLYLFASGCKQNLVQSYGWASKGLADEDSAYARSLVDTLRTLMTPAQIDSAAVADLTWDPYTVGEQRRDKARARREAAVASGRQRKGEPTSADSTQSNSTTSGRRSRRP